MMLHCRCTKHMLEHANESTCLWCGHGDPLPIQPRPSQESLPPLPVNLGDFRRERRRVPVGVFENVHRQAA